MECFSPLKAGLLYCRWVPQGYDRKGMSGGATGVITEVAEVL